MVPSSAATVGVLFPGTNCAGTAEQSVWLTMNVGEKRARSAASKESARPSWSLSSPPDGWNCWAHRESAGGNRVTRKMALSRFCAISTFFLAHLHPLMPKASSKRTRVRQLAFPGPSPRRARDLGTQNLSLGQEHGIWLPAD